MSGRPSPVKSSKMQPPARSGPRAMRPTRVATFSNRPEVALRAERLRPGSGTAAGPSPDNRRASSRRYSAASGRAGRRATRRDRRRTTRTASREPDGRVWTASAAIGKMQLDGPTQPMQLSCSPRRRALMPSKAIMFARTAGGTPGVRDSSSAFSSQDAASSWSPSYRADERELPVDRRGPATPGPASAYGSRRRPLELCSGAAPWPVRRDARSPRGTRGASPRRGPCR